MSGSSWRKEYLQGLEDRDRREKAGREIFIAYASLADRTSVFFPVSGPVHAKSPSSTGKEQALTRTAGGTEAELSTENLAAIRLELVEAQKSRSQLETQLRSTVDQLEALKEKSGRDGRMLQQLSTERSVLTTKMRDRDEELRGKSKLLENLQDEMLALNIQLNLADERSRRLEKENKDLVDRWMARMGKEADAMNDASKFS